MNKILDFWLSGFRWYRKATGVNWVHVFFIGIAISIWMRESKYNPDTIAPHYHFSTIERWGK